MAEQDAIWKRIPAGDRQEFEAFYHAHATRILQFLCRITGNRHASEDITQEVFLQLFLFIGPTTESYRQALLASVCWCCVFSTGRS